MEELKFWDVEPIWEKNAHFSFVYGMRGNGKTYGLLQKCLEIYFDTGKGFGYVRRYRDDLRGVNGAKTLFDAHVQNGVVEKLSKGKWNTVVYYTGAYYLAKLEDDGKLTRDFAPFCWTFCIATSEHYKGNAWANVFTLIFDEFISTDGYLMDEPKRFLNLVSTVKRQKEGFRVFLLGNTINKFNPYFAAFGLNRAQNQEQGTIDLYLNQKNGRKMAVEYCSALKLSESNESFFAWDDPKLDMILNGTWETDESGHCPVEFKQKDILFKYFIEFDEDLLQCEVVQKDSSFFTYIHRRTYPLKEDSTDIIFKQDFNSEYYIRRNIMKPVDEIGKKIKWFFDAEKVFYQDNEVGEMVRNYILWCTTKK